MKRMRSRPVFLTCLFLSLPPGLRGQEGPPPDVAAAIDAVITILESPAHASLGAIERHLHPDYRASFTDTELQAHFNRLRDAARGGLGGVDVMRTDAGLVIQLENGARYLLQLDEEARILRLTYEGRESSAVPLDSRPSWQGLGEWFADLEALGFDGVVLARRGGRQVLRRGYGYGNRTTGAPSHPRLMYGIGSAPIGFTSLAAVILADNGRLDLDAPVARYLVGVPEDKAGLTSRMILESRSGLPDFHHREGDRDRDLTWIDRDEAVRRILSAPLLFEPGTDEAHSHSAFGLLAAVVEIVSRRPYADFVRRRILEPLDMENTGFYGETLGHDGSAFAEGYGDDSVGTPNIPPNWGPASWLVMGSGGMFSTLEDLDRFDRSLDEGDLTTGESGFRLRSHAVSIDGSDRGFFMVRARNDHGDLIHVMSNGLGDVPERELVSAIVELVRGR